eukprot:TRINITY_DN55917_c0_g1_i1.p1 TRINITY_DN55917_c0_g1~~TRINITY_DN55917_c0_g1_i1.p1  ORF type:complete len:686 (+),score=187.35 TRINITY_DN55917_c0_g1_i1:155-2212(+)
MATTTQPSAGSSALGATGKAKGAAPAPPKAPPPRHLLEHQISRATEHAAQLAAHVAELKKLERTFDLSAEAAQLLRALPTKASKNITDSVMPSWTKRKVTELIWIAAGRPAGFSPELHGGPAQTVKDTPAASASTATASAQASAATASVQPSAATAAVQPPAVDAPPTSTVASGSDASDKRPADWKAASVGAVADVSVSASAGDDTAKKPGEDAKEKEKVAAPASGADAKEKENAKAAAPAAASAVPPYWMHGYPGAWYGNPMGYIPAMYAGYAPFAGAPGQMLSSEHKEKKKKKDKEKEKAKAEKEDAVEQTKKTREAKDKNGAASKAKEKEKEKLASKEKTRDKGEEKGNAKDKEARSKKLKGSSTGTGSSRVHKSERQKPSRSRRRGASADGAVSRRERRRRQGSSSDCSSSYEADASPAAGAASAAGAESSRSRGAAARSSAARGGGRSRSMIKRRRSAPAGQSEVRSAEEDIHRTQTAKLASLLSVLNGGLTSASDEGGTSRDAPASRRSRSGRRASRAAAAAAPAEDGGASSSRMSERDAADAPDVLPREARPDVSKATPAAPVAVSAAAPEAEAQGGAADGGAAAAASLAAWPAGSMEAELYEWLRKQDSGKGALLRYFDKIRSEFDCDFSQIAAAKLADPISPGAIGLIDPTFWEACEVKLIGHRLLLANAIAALAD